MSTQDNSSDESHKPQRIVYLLPDLSGGGAEKIVIEYLTNIDRSLFEPVLVLCRKSGSLLSRVPSDVPVHHLQQRSILSLPLLAIRFRQLMKCLKPQAVCSCIWYADAINIVAAMRGSPWLAICSIHCVPRTLRKENAGPVKSWLMKRLYPKADGVIAVSKPIAVEFRDIYLGRSAVPVSVLPNPYPFRDIQRLSAAPEPAWPSPRGNRIVVVGRLDQVKGHDRLIDALPMINGRWHLNILGNGPLRSALEKQVHKNGVQDSVTFLGFAQNPYPAIASADVLVLPSRYEAFPTVIFEALFLGTKVVATDCPSGPRKMLHDGELGVLVVDMSCQALADAINETLAQIEGTGGGSDDSLLPDEQREKFDAPQATRSMERLITRWISDSHITI